MDYTVVTARQTGNNRAIAAVTQITCTNRANLYVKREAIHKNIEKTVPEGTNINCINHLGCTPFTQLFDSATCK